MTADSDEFIQVWGPYPVYDDISRLQYGRILWRKSAMRERLLRHWLDERHPYRDRFQEHRTLVEEVLESSTPDKELDQSLRARNTSLRCVTREIPPVFGHFWKDSANADPSQGTACANGPDS
jgi:hypothetical protein